MEIFIDDDASYLAWISAHPTGYLLNVPRGRVDHQHMTVHRATCGHIKHEDMRYTTTTYYKICSMDRARLLKWVATQRRGLDTCRNCDR
jgi:hypothetical protein